MAKQGNSDRTANRAEERENPKEGSMSRKVKTLFRSIGIPRSPISKKVGRLLKSRPNLLEPFMEAYLDAKSYLPQDKNAQVDGMADPDTSSVAETKKSSKPFDDETEADDWGSGEATMDDYDNEQHPDDDSSAADFEFGDHSRDGEIESYILLLIASTDSRFS